MARRYFQYQSIAEVRLMASGSGVPQALIDTINQRLDAIESALKSAGLMPTNVVVLSARYEVVADLARFVDVTGDVQRLHDSGATWRVHPGLTDFAEGFLKQLRVKWTRDGVERDNVFTQFDLVKL
jgi:hypothetical protein